MRPASRRPGFTLIELLLVIAVIGILAAAVLPLANGAINSQRKARATGHIRAIAGACDAYRKLYGEFPLVRPGTYSTLTADYPAFRQDLFAQLAGTKVVFSTVTSTGATSVQLVSYNDATAFGARASKRVIRPLLTTSLVPGCDDNGKEDVAAASMTQFIDPWGNAYDYRHRIACTAAENTFTTGTNKYSSWRSPEFLLVSCGKEFVASSSTVTPHVPSMEEYWHASLPTGAATFNMTTTGTVSTSYFQDGTGYTRSDNITSWSGR